MEEMEDWGKRSQICGDGEVGRAKDVGEGGGAMGASKESHGGEIQVGREKITVGVVPPSETENL